MMQILYSYQIVILMHNTVVYMYLHSYKINILILILNMLNDELHKALDTITPLKQIQVAVCQKQPWFNEIVKARHKVVQNREQIWHKYPTPNTWKA